MMDDDWSLLRGDHGLFPSSATSDAILEDDDEDLLSFTQRDIKPEPVDPFEESSDYHGSSSVSPSSSLSSPCEFKDFTDFSSPLCVNPFLNCNSFMHSPSSSSSFSNQPSQTSLGNSLPPMSQFSQHQQFYQNGSSLTPQLAAVSQHQPQLMHQHHHHPATQTLTYARSSEDGSESARSPSPPYSDGENEGLALSALQAQHRSRSKMHEMAIKQKLITEHDSRTNGCLQLSAEEKRTLLQEGYPIPTKFPLSRAEEEALKIVRRKIKNKLSAQESRRKRKEYMDSLEQRVQQFYNENQTLRQRLKQAELNNRSLITRVKQLEGLLAQAGLLEDGCM